MDHLSCNDIKERYRNTASDYYVSKSNQNIKYIYNNLSENYSFQKAKLLLENWRDLGKTELTCLDKVLEIFDIIVDNDSICNIKNAANIIEGNIVKKVRDGEATRHLNNYKLGKLKIQNTKVLNHTKDNTSSIERTIKNKGKFVNTLHPNRKYKYDIYGKRIEEKEDDSKNEEDKKEEVKQECCNRFLNRSWKNDQCDRVIANHNKLSKRFSIDKYIRSNSNTPEDCIYELCEMIDSYDSPFGVKYNIALENILYLASKNCIDIPKKLIVESVSDYFLLSRDTDEDMLHDMEYIIKNSKFYNDEDFDDVKYLYDDIEDEFTDESYIYNKYNANSIIEESKKKEEKKKNKDNTVKKELHKFKKSNNKTLESFKACISRIFVNSPENIINDLPDIFSAVRGVIIIFMLGINPIIGLIGTITGFFLKVKVGRERMNKVIEDYRKERNKYKEKARNAKDDKEKEKYNAIVKKFDDDIYKLEEYESTLYTEKENDKREEERYAREEEEERKNNKDNSDDFDFDDDFGFDDMENGEDLKKLGLSVEQLNMINNINDICIIEENMKYDMKNIMYNIRSNIQYMSSSDIYTLSESVCLCNDIFNCNEYKNILEDELVRCRQMTGLQKYEKIDAIKTCIESVNKYIHNDIIQSFDEDISIDTMRDYIKYKQEVMDDTIEMINEGKKNKEESQDISFGNKLKIASANLKRTAMKLKDKDKEISDKMDNNVNRFKTSAKNAMISDNREAIIRGQLLPSASKCIKLAVVSGATFLVAPALAVIGVIGYIATSKKLQKRERQLILDDIEIEIQMCDKYLRLAEDKNDMKAVRNIMQTKRSLERQKQRLKYNMTTQFKEKIPKNPKSSNDNYNYFD